MHRTLAADDPGLPRRVADLIRGEHELPCLDRAVSGTFDVDRCDYLLRDAHATGVRYGDYDLPWLLRSLRFSEPSGPPGHAAPSLAIDGQKGIVAIESFLLARYFMFQQVYFHKATRSAEWMIGAILCRAHAVVTDGTRLPVLPEAIAVIAASDVPSLEQYLKLDDEVLLGAIRAWEDAKDPVLSDLCKRLRARALFKTIDLAPSPHDEESTLAFACPDEPTRQRALAKARDIASSAGLDPDLYVGLDVATDVPYAEDDSLRVVFPHGRSKPPSRVSFLLDRLRNETLTRCRIIFAPELRDAMREAFIH